MNIEIRYISFLVIITGKMKEIIQTNATTVKELIKELGAKYEGFSDIFLAQDQDTELRSVIYLRRKNEPPQGVIDANFKLAEEDIFMFW